MSLRRNDFEFVNQFYLQVKGKAIDKMFAPAYANIYMAEWEQTVKRINANSGPNYTGGTWTISLGNRWTFPMLTIDLFLDTTVFEGLEFKTTCILDTKVYFKPTDKHTLLHKASHHPRHTLRGIVKGQIIRHKCI